MHPSFIACATVLVTIITIIALLKASNVINFGNNQSCKYEQTMKGTAFDFFVFKERKGRKE